MADDGGALGVVLVDAYAVPKIDVFDLAQRRRRTAVLDDHQICADRRITIYSKNFHGVQGAPDD